MNQAQLIWQSGLRFTAQTAGHQLTVDSNQENPSAAAGPTPMNLFLVALAGCTSMDVIFILQKKRLAVSGFQVAVSGVRRREPHPLVFEEVELLFTVRGQDIPAKAVQEAIALSRDRYCSVAGMVKGPLFRHRFVIEDEAGNPVREGLVE